MNELRRTIEVTGRAATGDACQQSRSSTAAWVGKQPTVHDERSVPSFFVVGPPRTGSSWLHEILRPFVTQPVKGDEIF